MKVGGEVIFLLLQWNFGTARENVGRKVESSFSQQQGSKSKESMQCHSFYYTVQVIRFSSLTKVTKYPIKGQRRQITSSCRQCLRSIFVQVTNMPHILFQHLIFTLLLYWIIIHLPLLHCQNEFQILDREKELLAVWKQLFSI